MASSTERERRRFYEDATNRIGSNSGRIELDEDGTVAIEESNFHGDGHVIHIVHVPTNSTVHFKAFLTEWNDTFTQEWDSTTVIGRMDPIMTYKRTGRKITFGWDVPSGDFKEAAWNFVQAEKLMAMSYPTFEDAGIVNADGFKDGVVSNTVTQDDALKQQNSAINSQQNTGKKRNVSIMSSPPIFKIKFSTWLANSNNSPESRSDALDAGLYGVIESLSFSPKFTAEDGGFYGGEDAGEGYQNVLIPKKLNFTCNFTVLHTNPLGYHADTGKQRTESFPYRAQNMYNKISTGRKIIVK